MEAAWVLRGKCINGAFVPDHPLPNVEGPAEFIVYTTPPAENHSSGSIFELFGKAAPLRTAADLDKQLADERQSWPEV